MSEYAKFINAIDSFESYSQKVIENCEDFIQTAINIGSKIGDVVGKGAGQIATYVDDSNVKGAATKIGLAALSTVSKDLFSFGAGAIGELRKNAKYKAATKKIREEGINWKTQCLGLIPHSIEICKIRIEDAEKEIQLLKEEVFKSASNLDYKNLENDAKKIRNCIQHIYQAEYRLELAEKITFYFENFENQLEDLEQFSYWYNESILVNKIDCYEKCYENVYSKLSERCTDNQLQYLNKSFLIVDSMVPILAFKGTQSNNHMFINSIYDCVSRISRNKKYNEYLPSSCYEAEGLKKLFEKVQEHFEMYVIPKYKKIRNIMLLIPAPIITIIYTILMFTKIISLESILKLNIPDYAYILIVFAFFEILCLFIILLNKSNKYKFSNIEKFCCKYSPSFASDVLGICEEYAKQEKTIDENELKVLEQESQQISIDGENISEDDLLDSIIN